MWREVVGLTQFRRRGSIFLTAVSAAAYRLSLLGDIGGRGVRASSVPSCHSASLSIATMNASRFSARRREAYPFLVFPE
jgi:hypothetical protein